MFPTTIHLDNGIDVPAFQTLDGDLLIRRQDAIQAVISSMAILFPKDYCLPGANEPTYQDGENLDVPTILREQRMDANVSKPEQSFDLAA